MTRARSPDGLKWLAELRGPLKQADVAETIGVSQQMYSLIETGRRLPSVKVAKRLGALLGFDWCAFYDNVT